jgi:hypothetical protein
MRFRQLQAASLIAPDATMKGEITQKISDTLVEHRSAWQAYQPTIDPGEERRLADAAEAEWSNYQTLSARLEAISLTGDRDAAARFYNGELQSSYTKLRGILTADEIYNDSTAHASSDAAKVAYSQAIWMIGVGIAIAALIAVASAIWLNRNVTARIVGLAGTMWQLPGATT